MAEQRLLRHLQNKKPTWSNALRHWITSVYFSTSPPALAGLLFI